MNDCQIKLSHNFQTMLYPWQQRCQVCKVNVLSQQQTSPTWQSDSSDNRSSQDLVKYSSAQSSQSDSHARNNVVM